MLTPDLGVRPVVAGLTQPTTFAFLGANDLLVLEKSTGRVQRVTNGAIAGTVLVCMAALLLALQSSDLDP